MTAPTRTRIRFGDTETLTIADLRVGDFVETIPTQNGVRGMRVDSGIEAIDEMSGDAWADGERSAWRIKGSRAGERVDARGLRFMRTSGRFQIPTTFTVTARRRLAG